MPGDRLESVLSMSHDVRDALDAGRPVVAFETTLVTHGFAQPRGLGIALELQDLVRDEGVVPATIGVLGGRLRVGLSQSELQQLAATPDVAKLNPGNLAAGIASGEAGSTTVAATLVAAGLVGIRVLATGGIGGVHRGAQESGDISADLMALARVPVAVVCAGAKAILDLPRTLETLETLGIPVYGFGSDRFPAFYRRDSGLAVDRRFDQIDRLASAIRTHFGLQVGSGVVVANPIPAASEMPAELYESSLNRALEELAAAGIRGREVTPYLLARLARLTKGQSVFSNRALLSSNTRLSAGLALTLAGS